jgi:hypothetical protein
MNKPRKKSAGDFGIGQISGNLGQTLNLFPFSDIKEGGQRKVCNQVCPFELASQIWLSLRGHNECEPFSALPLI